MVADHIGPYPPLSPAVWSTWLKLPDRIRYRRQPSGEWREDLHLNAGTGPGVPVAGGQVSGRIDGAHGHLMDWLAQAMGTLKVDGVPVLTGKALATRSEEIVKRLTPKEVITNGRKGIPTEGLVAHSEGFCLFRADNQPVTVLDEVLPRFPDETQATWDHTLFMAIPMPGAPRFDTMTSGPGRFRVLSGVEWDCLAAVKNCGYPMGFWLHRIPGSGAPVYRAFNADAGGHANAVVAHYMAWGFR